MPKLLLINPANPFNGYHVPLWLRKQRWLNRVLNFSGVSLFPPLNLGLLAAMTPSDWKVSLQDGCVEPIDFEEDADLVGLTSLTGNANSAYEIADRFRARGTRVVMGGAHVTVLPQEALQHCDAVALGEAEGSWETLLRDFRQGQLKPVYRGTKYHDMKGNAWARRDLFQKSRYLVPNTIETSRGCPYDCEFCSVTAINGGTYRVRPIEEVIPELETFENHRVFFVDDIINGHPRHAKELFRAMIPLKLYWGAQATINIARDEELLELAAASGCKFVFLGLESFTSQDLRKLGRFEDWRRNFFIYLKKIQDKGITIWGAFVLGLDSDNLESLEETVENALEAGLDFAQFTILTPLPGTKTFTNLFRDGRIFNFDWKQYTYGGVVINPKQMSEHELASQFIRSWRKFYSLRSIWRRLRLWPIDRQNMVVWAVNFGINRSFRYSLEKLVVAPRSAPPAYLNAGNESLLPETGIYSIDRLYHNRLHIAGDKPVTQTAPPSD